MAMLALALAFGSLGAVIGVVYFAALRWNVRFYLRGRRGWAAGAMHAARFIAAVLCFTLIARGAGAVALLSAFAGFLAVRTIAVHRVRRQLEEAI